MSMGPAPALPSVSMETAFVVVAAAENEEKGAPHSHCYQER